MLMRGKSVASDATFDDADVVAYDSMAAFYASIGGHLPQDIDFTIHRLQGIHREVPYRSPRFRANYFSIVVISAGHGRYYIDRNVYDSRGGMLHFTNPGHVKGFEIIEAIEGFVITFGESFLKHYVHGDIYREFPYLLAEVAPPAYLEPSQFAAFESAAENLLREFEGASVLKYKMIGSLMMLLLLRIKESFWIDYDPQREAGGNTDIVRAFNSNLESLLQDLAKGTTSEPIRVSELAKRQNLHPNYLSTVIKRKTGKAIKSWILEKNLIIAKSLLSGSNVSLKQIAYRLGYSEPAHFTRFFKDIEGVSPSVYRREVSG
jgi:AraC family transcriptional regulator, transcriptional activator of pobA